MLRLPLAAAPLALIGIASITASCQLIFGLDDYETAPSSGTTSTGQGAAPPTGPSSATGTGGEGGDAAQTSSASTTTVTTSSSSTSSSSGAGGFACPSTFGPEMILAEAGDKHVCIDATEVTRLQYDGWLGTNPSKTGQGAECTFNEIDGFKPKSSGSGCTSTHVDVNNEPNHPVVCIDWCDAQAFCKAAGKRLCGGIGGQAYTGFDFANAAKSEWFFACSTDGASVFPYGDTFGATTCVGDLHDGISGNGTVDEVDPVRSAAACVGGFPGLHDMSGNASEWEDGCLSTGGDPSTDSCHVRGGSFKSATSFLQCDANKTVNRASFATDVGFRCCADP